MKEAQRLAVSKMSAAINGMVAKGDISISAHKKIVQMIADVDQAIIEAPSPIPGKVSPLVYAPADAMVLLNVGRALLYQLINTGELVTYMTEGSRKITMDSIRDYMKRRIDAEKLNSKKAA